MKRPRNTGKTLVREFQYLAVLQEQQTQLILSGRPVPEALKQQMVVTSRRIRHWVNAWVALKNILQKTGLTPSEIRDLVRASLIPK